MGRRVTKILREVMDEAQSKHGLKVGLRVTPNDIREFERPPHMRQGKFVDDMFRSFELNAAAGADMLAIESTGGKEIHDDAILNGDLPLSVFALGVLGSRDMAFLWDRIVSISHKYASSPPAIRPAVLPIPPWCWPKTITCRGLGRGDPGDVCTAQPGRLRARRHRTQQGLRLRRRYIKAITGSPIALEGAEAACAHLSPIGNITKAVPDLWSNESVQNIKLLAAWPHRLGKNSSSMPPA